MQADTLITRKNAGHALTKQQINLIIAQVCDHSMSDSQVSAFTKAVFAQGMTLQETGFLTDAMRRSGQHLTWSVNGPVVDKHSTGGVGDLVSLILAPLLAACGCYVPMISGRCLGHTGGTVDKLESIPGYQVQPALDKFAHCVEQVGVAIIGQSDQLAPADKRLYAMRNKNNTVNSLPLIVSSILSKKLAEGLDALILDIKVGNGAWFATEQDAQPIKQAMQSVAQSLGVKTLCELTAMDSPISYAVGNAVEVKEAISFLTNTQQHQVLRSLVFRLACDALVLSGQHHKPADAITALEQALTSGAAAERFAKMVCFLGGPSDFIDKPEHYMPQAQIAKPVLAKQNGTLSRYDMKQLGELSHRLSHIAESGKQAFDHSTGICDLVPEGTSIQVGQPIVTLHAASESDWLLAEQILLSRCINIDDATTPENQSQPDSYEKQVHA